MVKTNARWAGYLFIALGLINWRYQDSNPNAATNSLFLIAGGVLTLILAFTKPGLAWLSTKSGKVIGLIAGAALIIFSFIN
ncbi:MAG: hypothetical protein RLZZ567_69 [Actinomycetota bacterium]|jgi:hypothetical protein